MKSQSQPVVKTAQICRYFTSRHGCRFGEQCRYRHQEVTKQDNKTASGNASDLNNTCTKDLTVSGAHNGKSLANTEEIVEEPKEVAILLGEGNKQKEEKSSDKKKQRFCRFFMKGYCREGTKCKFSHTWNSKKSRTKSKNNFEAVTQNLQEESVTTKKNVSVNRPSVLKPNHFSECLSDLSDEGMKYLQKVEIDQLKKRFGNSDVEIVEQESGVICHIKMQPTDPDWPYDVKEVELCVLFPHDYPKKIFEVEMADNGQFPEHFTQHVNYAIEKYLKEHEAAQKLRNTPDLLFRPFLRWLDRNLENLFTKALKQIKFDTEAQSAGLQFIPFVQKTHGEEEKETREEDSKEIEIKTLSIKDKTTEQIETETSHDNSRISPGSTILSQDVVVLSDDTTLSQDVTTGSQGETTVSQGDTTGSQGETTMSQGDTTGSQDESTELSSMFGVMQSKESVKKGTEVRFRGLELHENTATLRLVSLTFTIVCSRCKNREELPNVKENTQVVLTCPKCSNAQSIVLTSSELVHQHSSTVAFIKPQGCFPLDLILTECQMMLGCLNCSKETSVKGIHYGSTKNVWCFHCHQKLDFKVDSTRFHQLQQDKTTDTDVVTVRLKKNSQVKDVGIKNGEPLPSNGTCKHYKKSYRWMRFPCCGKCYPCDECHDGCESHEMERATRMICGFCAKEQPFTQKGCISCQSFMTAVHTSHWEGGKGCRNKIKMSRSDNKKYSEKEKTVSRHATKEHSKKKQK